MLVDVHAHLDSFSSKEIEEIMKRCKNFSAIINNGLNNETNKKTIELSKKYKVVKVGLGLYPSEAIKLSKKEVEKELEFIRKNKPVAVGEIGLDFTYGSKEKQIDVFKLMLKLAEELNVPAIIHSRKAEKEVLEILESFRIKAVLHCFHGNKKLIKKAEKMSCMFSVPCVIVRSKHFQNLVDIVSLSKILTETDAPYLSPVKGKLNEPCNVKHTIKKISEIKNVNVKEIEKIVYMNYKNLFFC